MKRHEYFIKACFANMPLKLWWLTMCFSIQEENSQAPEDIELAVRKIDGKYQYKYQDQWQEFTDKPTGLTLFDIDEAIVVKPGQIENIHQEVQTKINRLIANAILMTSIFGDRVEYMNKSYQIDDIVKVISSRVVDDKDHIHGKTFSMSEYLKLCDRSNYITTLSSLFFVGSGPEMWDQPQWLVPYRNQLLEQYKDELHKPETAAKIDDALIKRYMEETFSKGGSSKYVINNGKQIKTAVKKLILSYGAEFKIGNQSNEVTYIPQALCEGIDPKNLPAMYNAQRAGSYGRGKETQEGGASVKEMMAATQNFTVQDQDCGSKGTVVVELTDKNKSDFIGSNFVSGGKLTKLTEETVGSYLGKKLSFRSPLYCKAGHTSWCVTCLGDKLSVNKDALPIAAMSIASNLMLLKMAKFHSKGMNLATLDLDEVLI